MDIQKRFDSATHIIGVIGHPIKHSYSPLMHNTALAIDGLNYIYLPFDVHTSNLESALKGMIALGIIGFNVTIPHKEKIIEMMHDISEEAAVIGAVNTIVNENGKLHGYNTDVNGIVETLLPFKDELADTTISVIGAGGASRAVIYALIRYFKVRKINIINRTVQKAESLKEYFSAKMHFDNFGVYELTPPDLVKVFSNSKLIINATAIGLFPNIDDTPTSITESFNNQQIVFDIIYTPLNTKFLKIAESKGAIILNGLRMFVEQGARSYEIWTGEKMPVDPVYHTLLANLQNDQNNGTGS
jgi:shikimate dehydrogenase